MPSIKYSRIFLNLIIIGFIESFSSTNNIDYKIPIFFDSTNDLHRDLKYHPEQSARITACIDHLKDHYNHDRKRYSRINLVDVAPNTSYNKYDKNNNSDWLYHEPFSEDELNHARLMLVLAHSEEYVSNFETKCRKSRERRIQEGQNPLGFIGYIDDDTYLTTESYDVCLRATAAWIRGVDHALNVNNNNKPVVAAVDYLSSLEQQQQRQRTAIALTRPPGHHATKQLANGFCLFNFCAAAALHATLNRDCRVSILDWDVHYGQGVADIVTESASNRIRYASIHQVPAFPNMGEEDTVTGGKICTIPMDPGTSWDSGFYERLVSALDFTMEGKRNKNSDIYNNGDCSDNWRPDLIIVSSGYDALNSDDVAGCSLTASDFGEATRLLLQRIKEEQCPPGLVLGLEGGYCLKQNAVGGNLQDAVLETIKSLISS